MSWKMDSQLCGSDISEKVRLGLGGTKVTDIEKLNKKFRVSVQNAFGVIASRMSLKELHRFMAKTLFKNKKLELYKDTAAGRQETQRISAEDQDDQVGHGHDDYKDGLRQHVQVTPAKVPDQEDQVGPDDVKESVQLATAEVPDQDDQEVASHDYKETRRITADRCMEYKSVAPMISMLEGCRTQASIDRMQCIHGKKTLPETWKIWGVPRMPQLKRQMQSFASETTGRNDYGKTTLQQIWKTSDAQRMLQLKTKIQSCAGEITSGKVIDTADEEFSVWSRPRRIPNNVSFETSKGRGGRRNGSVGPSSVSRIRLDKEEQLYSPKSPKELLVKEFEGMAEQREESMEDNTSEEELHINGCDRDEHVEVECSVIHEDWNKSTECCKIDHCKARVQRKLWSRL